MFKLIFLLNLACSDKDADTASAVDSTEPVQSSLSECGETVLAEGTPTAFSECFVGDEAYAACETCGYYTDVSLSQGNYDCITCTEGFEIDVHFEDCTGFCVEEGTALNPIDGSECSPVSDCVLE